MENFRWEKSGEVWHLYDNDKHVGMIYPYIDELGGNINTAFSGGFHTKDDCIIELNSVGTTLRQAKERILVNYLQDKTYEWWTK